MLPEAQAVAISEKRCISTSLCVRVHVRRPRPRPPLFQYRLSPYVAPCARPVFDCPLPSVSLETEADLCIFPRFSFPPFRVFFPARYTV